MQWRMTFFGEKNMRVTDWIVRLLLNTIAIYFALASSYGFAADCLPDHGRTVCVF